MTERNVQATDQGEKRVIRGFASDEFYRALASATRRRILFYLFTSEQSTIDKLADMLYGWSSTAEEGGLTATYDQLQTGLYHQHLPRLAASDLIEFDPDTGRVAATDWPEEVRMLIRHGIDTGSSGAR